MKTIVHLISGLEIGGTERMLERTLPRLPRWRHVVCTLTTPGPIGARLRLAGISVEALGLHRAVSLPGLFAVLRFLRQVKPDLLQTYLAHADVLGVLASRPAKVRRVVISVRSMMSELKYWPIIAFHRMAVPFVDAYLFNSSVIARKYAGLGLPKQKIRVIQNGLVIPPVNPVTDRGKERERLGFPKEAPIIACVGKLRPEKGQGFLLEAVGRLITEFPSLSLYFIGEGPLEPRLRRRTEQLGLRGRVEFLGNRTDVSEILSLADVFVLPSVFEGMSNALLEAMVAGLPIVASDLAENRAVVGPDEAFLVPPRDPAAIAGAISGILMYPDDARKRAHEARTIVKDRFDITQTIAALDEFYASLLSEGG